MTASSLVIEAMIAASVLVLRVTNSVEKGHSIGRSMTVRMRQRHRALQWE